MQRKALLGSGKAAPIRKQSAVSAVQYELGINRSGSRFQDDVLTDELTELNRTRSVFPGINVRLT